MKNKRTLITIKFLFLLLHLIYAPIALALVNQPDEESIRAAMVIGILRYAQLPMAEDDKTIQVCSIGQPLVEDKLKTNISGLRVNRKKLEFKSFPSKLPIENPIRCHVVIQGENTNTDQFVKFLAETDQNMLVICDGCSTGLKLASVELFKRNNAISFKVNLDLAAQNRVVFSSSLLEIASEIKGKSR